MSPLFLNKSNANIQHFLFRNQNIRLYRNYFCLNTLLSLSAARFNRYPLPTNYPIPYLCAHVFKSYYHPPHSALAPQQGIQSHISYTAHGINHYQPHAPDAGTNEGNGPQDGREQSQPEKIAREPQRRLYRL